MKEINRKVEIMLAAAALFKKSGYRAVTMRDLAENLGIKAPSLYNHIHSKQEILEWIIISSAETFTENINNVFPKPISSVEKLKEIIYMHVDITIEKTDFLACMNNDWMHLEQKQLAYFLEMRNAYETKFREIILKGIQTKELKNLDPEIMLFTLLTTLRTLNLWYAKKEVLNPNKLKVELSKALISGIKN